MLLLAAALLAASASGVPPAVVNRRMTAREVRFVETAARLSEIYNHYARAFAAGEPRDLRLERKLVRALRDFEKLLLPPDPDDSRTAPSLCPAK